jgi:hypothetical protein
MNKLNLVNTKKMAAQIDKPVSAVQRMARMRIIPSIRVGWRTRLFDPEAVRRALLKRTVHEVE